MNLGIGGSPMDIATNPANLGRTKKTQVEFGLGLPYIRSTYRDQFLDPDPDLIYANEKQYNVLAPLPYVGWTIPITKQLTYGGGIYIPGGGNGAIDGITRVTPNGQTLNQWAGLSLPGPIGDSKRIREEFSTTFYVIKFVNGISYELGDLSIGIAIEGIYSRQVAYQKYYDITGSIEIPGQGFDYRSRHAYSAGAILGLGYQFNSEWRIGYSYQTRSILPLDGGMQLGINDATYYRRTGVSATFNLPERHGLGLSWKNDWITIGTDFLYYNYGSYNRKFDQRLEDPWFPTPFGRTALATQNLNYHDAWAAGLGAEIQDGNWTYRGGFRYNTGVVRSNGINALQAGIMIQELVTAGFGWKFGSWKLDVAVNYIFAKRVKADPVTDWDLLHTAFSFNDIRALQFNHSLESDVPAILVGFSKEFGSDSPN